MTVSMVQEQIIRAAKELSAKGLVGGRSGNISARLANENVLITAMGSFLGMLDLDDLVEIDFTGQVLEGNKRPSSERLLHLEIYKARPDVYAIVHTHSPHASAYGFLAKKLRPINYECDLVLGDVPIAPYVQPGTLDFAEAAKNALGRGSAALLQRHGTVAVGESVFDALAKAELLEDMARVNYIIDMLSKTPATYASET